jgi:hypothetical protein
LRSRAPTDEITGRTKTSYAKEAALKFDLGQSAVSVAGGRSSTSGTPSPDAARARHKTKHRERERLQWVDGRGPRIIN